MKLEIKKIGNSTGVILPKEFLAQLGLVQGDTLYVTKLPDRSFKLAPYDPNHEKAMEIAREVMREYKDTFKALAK
ncbi:MAG: AbrB/MazE/SpoVT family DNA-binding domain-containing protein [Alphaproteobacteria bacterium]